MIIKKLEDILESDFKEEAKKIFKEEHVNLNIYFRDDFT